METTLKRRALLGWLATAAAAPAARAQGWPARRVRIVVPFPPGSAADAIPRRIALGLQHLLHTPCVVDNRPGAGGAIGADAVARAAPDGYTLLSHTSGITIQPHLAPAPFDPLRDLVPVTQTIAGSYLLVAPPSFPARDLREFVAAVRAAPGKYSYGSHGTGSGPHLAMELLKVRAGLFAVHVPYRGAAPALHDLLAGRLDFAFDTSFATLPHIRAGRLRALAVGGPQPLEVLPGVAPVAALYPGFDTDGWQGLFAPSGTPADIVQRLAQATAQALADPALVQQVRELGFRVVGSSPAAFAEVVRSDFEKWGRIVRERGIVAEGRP